ncbi:MAG: ArsR/SmtB family transcription factor [Mycobacteriales bacterium]
MTTDNQHRDIEPRHLVDPQVMRALSHPLRIRLLDVLAEHGPLTATQISDYVNQSPTTCSFHLRSLGRHGFVEEAGGGKGRSRPWRYLARGLFIDDAELDTEGRVAANQFRIESTRRVQAAYEHWLADRENYPARWQDVDVRMDWEGPIAREDLKEMSERVGGVLADYTSADRPRGDDAVRVHIGYDVHPVQRPSERDAIATERAARERAREPDDDELDES